MSEKTTRQRRYVYSSDRTPYIVHSLPTCERLLSHSFCLSMAHLFGASTWAELLESGSHWAHIILRCIERELFDVDHFIGVHCGADTSMAHPQASGLVDPLSAMMFPYLQHASVFPSAPVSVKHLPPQEVAAVILRYQQAFDSVGAFYGARERDHIRAHYMYLHKGRGEPTFELGLAMDAKAHVSSTIMEMVTKQRLSLCLPKDSNVWKYFNYSFLRSFVVATVCFSHTRSSSRKSASACNTVPLIEEVSNFANEIKVNVKERRLRAEIELLNAVRSRPVTPDAAWLQSVFEPMCRVCCRSIASEGLVLAQLTFLNELLESVPDCGELLRLMSADPSSVLDKPHNTNTLKQSTRPKTLTPALYQT